MKAIENCHLLGLSKVELAKIDAEYEEILADLFTNAQKKLKKTLKIKDESESYYLKKSIQARLSNKDYDESQIRRLSTALVVRKNNNLKQSLSSSNGAHDDSKGGDNVV